MKLAAMKPAMKRGCAAVMTMALLLSGCVEPSGQRANDGSTPPAAREATVPDETRAEPAAAEDAGDAGDHTVAGVPQAAPDAGSGDGATAQDATDAVADGAGTQAEAGNSDADVDLAIDTALGDHEAYRDVFDRLQQGIAAADRAAVASLVVYPLEVKIDGKRKKIRNAGEFVASWDKIVTPEIVQVVSRQRYRDLFVNWQGAMLGDGQVWINGICRDSACKKVDVGVTAFQAGPQ